MTLAFGDIGKIKSKGPEICMSSNMKGAKMHILKYTFWVNDILMICFKIPQLLYIFRVLHSVSGEPSSETETLSFDI